MIGLSTHSLTVGRERFCIVQSTNCGFLFFF